VVRSLKGPEIPLARHGPHITGEAVPEKPAPVAAGGRSRPHRSRQRERPPSLHWQYKEQGEVPEETSGNHLFNARCPGYCLGVQRRINGPHRYQRGLGVRGLAPVGRGCGGPAEAPCCRWPACPSKTEAASGLRRMSGLRVCLRPLKSLLAGQFWRMDYSIFSIQRAAAPCRRSSPALTPQSTASRLFRVTVPSNAP